MVRNGCLDYVRHNALTNELIMKGVNNDVCESLYQADFMPGADQATIYNELKAEIEQLIKSMPDKQRQVFMLSRNDELKNQEIADRLDISLKAVEKHITAALKFLRTNLKSSSRVLLALIVLIIDQILKS